MAWPLAPFPVALAVAPLPMPFAVLASALIFACKSSYVIQAHSMPAPGTPDIPHHVMHSLQYNLPLPDLCPMPAAERSPWQVHVLTVALHHPGLSVHVSPSQT
jgi:hypothetical protein